MNQDNQHVILKGHIFALLTVIAWGTSYIVSKNMLTGVTAVQLIWMRFIVAYIILWILHPKWHFHLREEGLCLLLSLFSNTLYFLAENSALRFTQSSNVSILASTIPLMTAVLLRVFKKVRMTRLMITGSLIAFCGVILVVCNGVFNLKLSPVGDILALLAALSWSVYSLLIRDGAGSCRGFLLSRKLMFYGILTMTPILLITGPDIDFSFVFTGTGIASLLYLGIICSALCYCMWNEAIRSIGVSATNMYIYAMPLFTLAGGALILGERITLMGGAGILAITAGMVITNLKKR